MSTDGTPPALALLQQALGFWISRAICVVARLGIADLLNDGPLDTETLATAAFWVAMSCSVLSAAAIWLAAPRRVRVVGVGCGGRDKGK